MSLTRTNVSTGRKVYVILGAIGLTGERFANEALIRHAFTLAAPDVFFLNLAFNERHPIAAATYRAVARLIAENGF